MALLRSPNGQETSLSEDRTTLGRGAACDVVLDSPGVAPHHAAILRTDRGWLLVDESGGHGLRVNGRVVTNHFLRDGETIALGGSSLSFSDRGATLVGTPRPAMPAESAPLVVQAATGSRATPSSTPTQPGTLPPAPAWSSPTLRAEDVGPATDVAGSTEISGQTLPSTPIAPSAPIAAPPEFGVASPPAPSPELPRSTASIYAMGPVPPQGDDRPFVDDAPRRTPSVYSMGDGGPRASLDPVVDVYTLGRPTDGASTRSIYSLGTAPASVTPPRDGPAYAPTDRGRPPPELTEELGTAPTRLGAPAPATSASASVYELGARPPGTGSRAASVYELGAPARPPGAVQPRGTAPRATDSWSWVQPDPSAGGRRTSALPRPGRGLMVAGLVLVVLGLLLGGTAFALGLSLDDVKHSLLGVK